MGRTQLTATSLLGYSLLLLLLAAVSLSSTSADICQKVCADIRTEVDSLLTKACVKAWIALPRPKVGNSCRDGFIRAFEDTCEEACLLSGTGRPPKVRVDDGCSSMQRAMPRPAVHTACVTGYTAGFKDTKAALIRYITALDEEDRNTLLTQNRLASKDGAVGEVAWDTAAGQEDVELIGGDDTDRERHVEDQERTQLEHEAEERLKVAAEEDEKRKHLEAEEKRRRYDAEESRKKIAREEKLKKQLEAEEKRRQLEAEERALRITEKEGKRKELVAEEKRRHLKAEGRAKRIAEEEGKRKGLEAEEKRRQLEAEERAKRTAEEEGKRKKLEADKKRRPLEAEERAARIAEAEGTRKELEVEEKRKELEAEEKKRQLILETEERRRKKAEEEAEEEGKRKQLEEEDKRKRFELETGKKQAEDEEMTKHIEAEGQRRNAIAEVKVEVEVKAAPITAGVEDSKVEHRGGSLGMPQTEATDVRDAISGIGRDDVDAVAQAARIDNERAGDGEAMKGEDEVVKLDKASTRKALLTSQEEHECAQLDCHRHKDEGQAEQQKELADKRQHLLEINEARRTMVEASKDKGRGHLLQERKEERQEEFQMESMDEETKMVAATATEAAETEGSVVVRGKETDETDVGEEEQEADDTVVKAKASHREQFYVSVDTTVAAYEEKGGKDEGREQQPSILAAAASSLLVESKDRAQGEEASALSAGAEGKNGPGKDPNGDDSGHVGAATISKPFSMPITVGGTTTQLVVQGGQNDMEVVAQFCREKIAGQEGCQSQLIGLLRDMRELAAP